MELEKKITKAINRCLLEMGDCQGCPYRGDKCSDRLNRDVLLLIYEKNKIIREKEAELIEWRARFGTEAAAAGLEVSADEDEKQAEQPDSQQTCP